MNKKGPKKTKKQKRLELEKAMLAEFIECYKNNPILWDQEVEKQQSNRKYLKQRAYEKLAQILRNVNSNAHIVDVKRKINTLRSSYRKECKKVIRSQNEGGPIYKPNMWWYKLMLFINYGNGKSDAEESEEDVKIAMRSHEVSTTTPRKKEIVSSASKVKSNPKISEYVNSIETIDEDNYIIEESPDAYVQIEKVVEMQSDNEQTQTSEEYEYKIGDIKRRRINDNYYYLSKIWASKLRKISGTQSLLAEKAINDILFNAELGLLTPSTARKTIPSSSYFINIESVKDDSMDFIEEDVE